MSHRALIVEQSRSHMIGTMTAMIVQTLYTKNKSTLHVRFQMLLHGVPLKRNAIVAMNPVVANVTLFVLNVST
jgi:hypothetical protein